MSLRCLLSCKMPAILSIWRTPMSVCLRTRFLCVLGLIPNIDCDIKPARVAQIATNAASGPTDAPAIILNKEASAIGSAWFNSIHPCKCTHWMVLAKSPGSPTYRTVYPKPTDKTRATIGIHNTVHAGSVVVAKSVVVVVPSGDGWCCKYINNCCDHVFQMVVNPYCNISL